MRLINADLDKLITVREVMEALDSVYDHNAFVGFDEPSDALHYLEYELIRRLDRGE